MEHTEDSDGDELAMRLDADIDLDDGWLDSLRVGVRRAERDQEVNWSTYNWGSVQPLWGVQDDEAVLPQPGSLAGHLRRRSTSVSNLVGGGVFGGGTFIHPRYAIVSNYQATIDLYGNGHSNSWVDAGPIAPTARSIPTAPAGCTARSNSRTSPKTSTRRYVMLKFGGDDTKIGNVSVRGNIGVRCVKTDGRGDRWYAVPDLDAAPATAAGSGQPDRRRSAQPRLRRTTSPS